MEYSVGSLSDLIRGTNTPNKKKVVKKQFKQKPVEEIVTLPQEQQSFSTNSAVKNKKKKIETNGVEDKETVLTENDTKKRKIVSIDTNEPVVKKCKKNRNSHNAVKRIKATETIVKEEEDPELRTRTVFVGNLPLSSDTKKLKRFFSKYGKVDSVRIRGVPVADPKTSKKVAAIKKEFNPNRKSFYAFIRFQNREGAVEAIQANGTLFQDHHLRVHLCDGDEKPDEHKAIFIGNLSFYAEEDDLWNAFESCGPISFVRIVRDSKTGMGKGFGYVNFENSDSVTLALEMENVKIKDRELRISICKVKAAKKKNPDKAKTIKNKLDGKQIDTTGKNRSSDLKEKKTSYQGVKFMAKKKKKINKGLLQKKKMTKKIAPK